LFSVDQKGKFSDTIRDLLSPDINRDLEEIRNKAHEKIEKSQLQNKKRYNLQRKIAYKYKAGDYVKIRNIETIPGINKKLLPKFKALYCQKGSRL